MKARLIALVAMSKTLTENGWELDDVFMHDEGMVEMPDDKMGFADAYIAENHPKAFSWRIFFVAPEQEKAFFKELGAVSLRWVYDRIEVVAVVNESAKFHH